MSPDPSSAPLFLIINGRTAEVGLGTRLAAIAAVTAGEVQCVLVTPETLLNNLVARENPLKSTLSAAFNGDSGG